MAQADRVLREVCSAFLGGSPKLQRSSGWRRCWRCGANAHTARAVPLCKACESVPGVRREDESTWWISEKRGR